MNSGSDAEEVSAPLPAHALLINESDIDFVDERCRLQCLFGPLAAKTGFEQYVEACRR